MSIPILFCGVNANIQSIIKETLRPGVNVLEIIPSAQIFEEIAPRYLLPRPSIKAIATGGCFNDEKFAELQAALPRGGFVQGNVIEDHISVLWLRPDLTKIRPRPADDPEAYAKVVAEDVRSLLDRLSVEAGLMGEFGGGGRVVFY